MSRVIVLENVDRSTVYHTDEKCPALTTNRVGWLAFRHRVTLDEARRKGRRSCKRCKSKSTTRKA